jgi:3-oxoacyl-[acyl-carrier protein] reductase
VTLSLEGRRALVGGASRGIGKGCAEALAAAGASVTLMARGADALESVRESLPSAAGQEHGSIAVDFASWEAVRDAAASDVDANGPVDILVNNTGGPAAGPAREAEPEAYAAAFEQHLLGNQTLVQIVQEGMIDLGYGRIINVISTSVVAPIRNLGVSNTIRGAVANWARTLAAELAPYGITVNNVLPGYIDTERLRTLNEHRAELAGVTPQELAAAQAASVPAGRLGTPDDIGAVVAFLASPAAGYVNGVDLAVDGGRLVALNT